MKEVREAYALKIESEDPSQLDDIERNTILSAIDKLWKEHLYNMDSLREGINLRAQGQKDPLVEYKNEAYKLFSTLMDSIKEESLHNLFTTHTPVINEFQQLLDHLGLPEDISQEEFSEFIQKQQAQQRLTANSCVPLLETSKQN